MNRKRTRKVHHRRRKGGENLMDTLIPDTTKNDLPQNVVAGDCAEIIEKAKKCQEQNAVQAQDLMAKAAEAQARSDAASQVKVAAQTAASTVSNITKKLRKLTPAEINYCMRRGIALDGSVEACKLKMQRTPKKGGKKKHKYLKKRTKRGGLYKCCKGGKKTRKY